MMLACKKCQSNLAAYLHRELPPVQRRKIARHLEACERCYRVYLQQQDLAQYLTRSVPLMGQGKQPGYNGVWTAIQQDLTHPRRTAPRSDPARYGFAALVATLMLLIPLT